MRGGFPVVDGVVITAFDSIEKVTLAKYGLPLLEPLLERAGLAAAFRHTFMRGA